MSNKEAVFKPWERTQFSHCSTRLLQPSAAALSTMAPYELHKRLINNYILCRKGATSLLKRDTSGDKTDYDVIRENHRFLWDDEDNPDTWEAQLAKKYYDKLFKEYCICDLTMYKTNKVAMRWRTEAELISGRGQFTCAEKHCSGRDHLRTWEVNFAYQEKGEKKNALVKLRLCPECSSKLNYSTQKREIKRIQKKRGKKDHASRDSKKHHKRKQADSSTKPNETADNTADTEKPDKEEEDESRVWREAGKQDEEKNREDEFEEYLEELFL